MNRSSHLRRFAAVALIAAAVPVFGACAPSGARDEAPRSEPAAPIQIESTGADSSSTDPREGISSELMACLPRQDREVAEGKLVYETSRADDGTSELVTIQIYPAAEDGKPDLSVGDIAILRISTQGCQSVYPDPPDVDFQLRDHISRDALYELAAEDLGWHINMTGGLEAFQRSKSSNEPLVECPAGAPEYAGGGPGDEFFPCVDPPQAAAYRSLGIEVRPWENE